MKSWFASRHEAFVFVSIAVLVGPILWSIHFIALYSIHTLSCVILQNNVRQLIPLLLIFATILAAAPPLLFLYWPRLLEYYKGDAGPFLRSTLKLLLVLSLVAIVWAGIAGVVVPACS
jgi:hypothetical protein